MKVITILLSIFAIISCVMAVKNEICALPHSADGLPNGPRCLALIRSWTYKTDANECVLFDYGGCGGNDNRFSSKDECEKMCKE